MDNAYISSTIYALRAKGSLSFCFSDYNSYYLLNDRLDRYQTRSSLSKCCSCCGISSRNNVPVNRSYLYGPRQSSLLQWSAYRKLILGGGDRFCNYYYNYKCYGCPPSYGVERGCCGVSCCVNERVVCHNSRRRSKVSCCCGGGVVGEGNSGVCDSGRVVDTEALLSLLSEEAYDDDEEEGCFVGRGKRRDWGLYKDVEAKERERISGSYERVSQEDKKKRASGDGVCECGKKKGKGGRRLVEGGASVRIIDSGEEGLRKSGKESVGAISRGENRRLRRNGSECSSYYSLSSSGNFDDESEVHDKHTLLAEESLSGYEGSRVKSEGRYVHEKDEHEEVSERRSNAFVGGVEWDRRNKLEKKRNNRFSEEVQLSGRESSQRRARVSELHGSNLEKISSSHEQVNDTKETSTLGVDLNMHTRKLYYKSENDVGETSTSHIRKSAENKEIQEVQRDDVKRTSQSRSRLDSTEENVEIAKDERRKEVSYKTEEENIKRNTQRVRRISEVEDHDTQRTSISQSRSEIGVIGTEEYRKNFSSSLQGREESQHRTSQQDIQKANARRNSQQATRISEVYDTNVEKTLITQSQTSVSNQVNNTNLISISYQGPTEPHPQTGQRPPQRVQSESDETTVVRASEMERIIGSQVTSETRVRQESEAISIGVLVGNTRAGNDQTDEKLRPIRPRKELGMISTSQESLRLGYQARAQKHDVEEGIQRTSQTTVIPPRSQSLSRSSVRAELESGFERQKVSSTTSESGSGSSYTNLRRPRPPLALQEDSYERTEIEPMYLASPEDALGSADCLQQSSAQFVGEFVEKARHEASSSGIQRVEEVSEVKLASEEDKNKHTTTTQPKKEDKSSSSGGSETKGPSAEMWDVSDPIVLKTIPKAEEPEVRTTTTENAIVKRSGRSLWNIIADLVTLKWRLLSEPSSSAASSRRRIPSNDSAVSEAWFSTHESEHSRGKNSKGSQSESKSEQLQVMGLSTPGHGTESDGFTDQMRYTEVDPSPSMTRVGSGSTSKRISLSGDDNLGWNEEGRSSRASPSGTEIVESPIQPPIRGESHTIISQVSDTTETQIGSMEQIEQHGPAKVSEASVAEGSGGGELKRRKLQRIKQVPKDRFDEWEEAFTLETEQRRLDEMFMREALLEAKKAADMWEVPVGAVLVHNGTIIARGYNLVEELRDSTAHAEMICIREASNQLRSWRLADTTLYVTLEPCPMCAGAILQARISTLVWGAPNKLLGADGSWIRLFPDGGDGGSNSDKPAPPVHPFHPNMNVRRGVLATDCAEVMQQFFQLRRKKKEKQATTQSPSSQLSVSHPSKLLKKMHDVFHIMFCL